MEHCTGGLNAEGMVKETDNDSRQWLERKKEK